MLNASPVPRKRLLRAEVSRIVPGLYGWLATVAAPVFQPGAPRSSRVFALLGLLALLGSSAVAPSRPRLSRALGVQAFVACCFATWFLLGARLRSDQLDSVRAALGAIGFLLHALAWGASPRSAVEDAPANLVPGVPLEPRHKPARAGALVLGVGMALAFLPTVLAFEAERPSASLLAHAFALGAGLLLLAAASEVSLQVGRARELPPWRGRASRALWSLVGLTALLAVGLLWPVLR